MPIQPLIQTAVFDIKDWEPDAEFAVYPQGARAKDAVFAPEAAGPGLVPQKRYLFKRSKGAYPDQFWGEIIAYRVGCLLGVSVPPAFAAIHSERNLSAALIEWFYVPSQTWAPGGDFIQQVRSNYDRRKGEMHNLEDVRVLMTALTGAVNLRVEVDWRKWWADALLFDALIGNTDRHQDNWGFVFSRGVGGIEGRDMLLCELGPYFDNGTSLGHERFMTAVQGWSDERVMAYVMKGTHHIKWDLDKRVNGHLALLELVHKTWKGTREIAKSRLDFSEDELRAALVDLTELQIDPPLSMDRLNFIIRLLICRLRLLKNQINEGA